MKFPQAELEKYINIRTGNARSEMCCPLTRVWITMDTRPQIRSNRYESVVSGCPFCFPWIRTTLLQPSLQPRVLVLVPLMIWEITFRRLPLKSPSLARWLSRSLLQIIHFMHLSTTVTPPSHPLRSLSFHSASSCSSRLKGAPEARAGRKCLAVTHGLYAWVKVVQVFVKVSDTNLEILAELRVW